MVCLGPRREEVFVSSPSPPPPLLQANSHPSTTATMTSLLLHHHHPLPLQAPPRRVLPRRPLPPLALLPQIPLLPPPAHSLLRWLHSHNLFFYYDLLLPLSIFIHSHTTPSTNPPPSPTTTPSSPPAPAKATSTKPSTCSDLGEEVTKRIALIVGLIKGGQFSKMAAKGTPPINEGTQLMWAQTDLPGAHKN
ncbi:hypothetical protein Syun_006420 [Stephania yunnanensis]|uniref:Uncharacterized protein n=1 Tax=Stephania yunnanensis TaxID=152371 RepID=A0AAP0KZZ0_9MAGN